MKPPACRLYLITPRAIDDIAAFAETLKTVFAAGDVGALQVRLKDAPGARVEAVVRAVKPLCRAHGVSLILNDRPDLAASLDCDGVHVGQMDGPLADARRIVGPDRIVGVTCHDSRHLAMDAAEGGADYVAFGAFFPTATKITTATPDLDILSIWQETMLIPCVAIGGITVETARAVTAAGADFVAVCAGVWDYPGGPAAAAAAFNEEIGLGLKDRPTA